MKPTVDLKMNSGPPVFSYELIVCFGSERFTFFEAGDTSDEAIDKVIAKALECFGGIEDAIKSMKDFR